VHKETIKPIKKIFSKKQSLIAEIFANYDRASFVDKKTWRKKSAIGTSISLVNDVFEKASINHSFISDKKLPQASLAGKLNSNTRSSNFIASGLSIIAHPKNPKAPTTHMNARIFILFNKNQIKDWWIGGGFDLTPYIPYQLDNQHWHDQAKKMLDTYNKKLYNKFAKNCDEYFYLPHRNERRGIGGIFFDNFKYRSINKSMEFLETMIMTFLDSYTKILNRRYTKPYTSHERLFQSYRRGRYVEFNLLFDRGTKFGIESGGRTDSILSSLPPNVIWPTHLPQEVNGLNRRLIESISKNWRAR